MTRIIAIDPGHGGPHRGAVGRTLNEAAYVLRFAREMAADIIVLDPHIDTILLRDDDDTDPSLAHRNAYANRRGAQLVLSIHLNASTSGSQRGTKCLYWPGNRLGHAVAEAIARAVPAPLFKRRIHGEHAWPALRERWPQSHRLCRAYSATCVLVELGHVDNRADEVALGREGVRRGLQAAVRCGIARWQDIADTGAFDDGL